MSGLLKTLWKKEKMLVTTMFSTLLKTSLNFSVKFILSSANVFNMEPSKNLSHGKKLKVNCIIRDGFDLLFATALNRGQVQILFTFWCLNFTALSCECVGLMNWWLRIQHQVEANFLSGVFLPLTSEAREKSSCVSNGVRKPGNTCASLTAMI